MRVLIDVSAIPARPDKRTGLARVALNLARALATRSDLDVSTCAWGSLGASVDFAEVSREFPELHGVQPRSNWWERLCVGRQRSTTASHALKAGLWHRAGQITNRLRNPLRGVALEDVDIVHSTYSGFPRIVRAARQPAVLTIHDVMPLVAKGMRFPSTYAGVVRRIVDSIRPQDWIACVSEWTRNDFLSLTGHSPERVVVIPNGVDVSVFQPCQETQAMADTGARFGIGEAPFVLSLSSLAPHKNLKMLCDAWIRDPDLAATGKLVLAGGRSTDAASLEKALGLPPDPANIVVTGHVSDAEFRHLASGCQAFLFPSLYEGFGLPALEAMACGAPVIASNTTSLPEVMGDAGRLLPPDDSGAWAAAMKEALERPLRREPDCRAVERAMEFSWDRAAAAYVALYRQALA